MQSKSSQLEKKYLIVSTIGSAVVALVGITAAMLSSSQAILLDGVFNLAYFVVGLFAIKVASLVAAGDDDEFPYGYAFLEPLVNGIKGTLVLSVSIMAVVGAVNALLAGGRPISAGLAIAYGVFATIVGAVVAYLMHRGVKQTDSPLVRADAENWLVNAAVSACVLIAFAGILLLRALDLNHVVPFVDPVVVLAVVTISITVPLRMMWEALMALLNRAPAAQIRKQVAATVDAVLSELPVQERFIRVLQPGRQRMVSVHVILPADHPPAELSDLDDVRSQMYQSLNQDYANTIVDALFSKDRQWGAPLSQGGSGSEPVNQ